MNEIMCLIPGCKRSPREGNATHFSILAWEIPWAEKPCGLHFVGSRRVIDFFRENPRDESPWNASVPQVPAEEMPERPEDALGPALHGPKAAHGAQRGGLPVTDDLQMARGPISQGWTGPPDSQEPMEQEAPVPYPVGAPHLPFFPTTPRLQLGLATVPPTSGEPGGQVGQLPPNDEGLLAKGKTRVSETFPWDHKGPSPTLVPQPGIVARPGMEEQGGGQEVQS